MSSGYTSWHLLLIIALSACSPVVAKPPISPVTAVEITENGKELAIPPTGVTEIDENSSIALRVDKKAAQAVLASSMGVDDAEVARLADRSSNLNNAINSQRAALSGLESQIRKPAPKTFDETKMAMQELSKLEKAALNDLEKVRSRNEINVLLAQRGGNSYTVAIQVLEKENTDLVRRLDDLTTKLSRTAWRMQAVLYTHTGSQSLHLEGYDDLAASDPNIINKLAIPTNLMAVLDETKAASANLKDLEDAVQKTRTTINARAQDLEQRLLKVADELEAIPDILDKAVKSPWASFEQVQQLAKNLENISSLAKVTLAACQGAFDQLRGLRSSSIEELSRVVLNEKSPVRQCIPVLIKNGREIVTNVDSLAAQIKGLRSAIKADAKLAKKVGEATVQEIDDLGKKVVDDATQELIAWWQTVEGLFTQGAKAGDGSAFENPERLNDRAYRDVSDTSIELVRTAREPGDVIAYRAASVNSGSETRQWTSAPMRVVVTGWHVNVSGSVVFVRALKPQDQDSAFPAAPAATATLHYGVGRDTNENRGNALWNFLDPGFGLHVAYLDLGPKIPAGATTLPSDPAMEIGVGGVIQLFGDVLQAGIAYDLQVQRSYAFFGVGLQTATNFGLTTPSGK